MVGGGTAGCIVATRLAEAGRTVMLLEAGGAYRRVLDIPLVGLWTWLRAPDRYAWNQHTVPQPGLDGRRVWFPGGRILGGSSSINAMIYSRGHPASYDRWDVPGWTYQDLLQYHRRAEDHEPGATPYHGTGGPMGTAVGRFHSPLSRAFIAACSEAGIAPNPDLNGSEAAGAAHLQVSQRRGRRSSTANAYLPLAGRHQGFHHRTGALVTRVLFSGGRAAAVVADADGRAMTFRASRAVVLCAGTVRSPQLLMLSGVGAADRLRRLGIAVVADRTAVGQSLQDQLRVPVAFRHDAGSPVRLDRLIPAGVRYVLTRRGLLASNVCDAGAVLRTSTAAIPDVRILFRWRVLPETGIPLVDLEVGMLAPASRGSVTLRSADPREEPDIDPGYLRESGDLGMLERGIDAARRIASQPALRRAGLGDEFLPGGTPVDRHVRAHATTAFHPVGTCRMGADPESVVDPALRVRGVDGLRVIDASVIPSCVAGNAQAGVIAVAERGADLLLAGD